MNRKGAVLHWIVFLILGAFGLFFILTAKVEIKGLDGYWQLNFLEDYYLEAEKDLLKMEEEAKFAGWEAVLELVEEGGGESECGILEGFNLRNDLEGFCLVDVEGNFLLKVKEKLGGIYSEFKLEGKDLIGKGEKKSIVTANPFDIPYANIDYASYTYNTSFRVNLGYNFDEYNSLLMEAQDLVPKCRGEVDLEKCVEEGRGVDWRLKDCDKEEYNETGRKVLFCVETGIKIYNSEKKLVPVRYKFALDFTEPEETG